MIYTLTINPAIDMHVTANELISGKTNRTNGAVYSVNGKGINVSFALDKFGIRSGVLGFFGGFTGEYIINECERLGFAVKPVKIEGTTRVNVFTKVGDEEYNLVNAGPVITKEEQTALIKLIENLRDIDVIIISGSLSKGIDESFYDDILSILKNKNINSVIDISSPKMKDLLKYRPLVIKPNDDELKEIFGFDIKDDAQAVYALKELHNMGAQNILLTMGRRGSYFYNGKDVYFCEVYPVKQKSSICAGDSFLAAFLSVWLNNPQNIEEALKLASATGANVAESIGMGDFSKVNEYKEKISVYKI